MLTWRDLKFLVLAMFVSGLGAPIVGLAYEIAKGRDIDFTVLGFAFIVYIFACTFIFLFGLPAFFLARRFKLDRWWVAVLSGAVLGCGARRLVLGPPSFNYAHELMLYASYGVVSALLFFWVWRCGQSSKH